MNGLIQMVSANGNSRRLPSAVYMGRPRIFGATALKKETTSPLACASLSQTTHKQKICRPFGPGLREISGI